MTTGPVRFIAYAAIFFGLSALISVTVIVVRAFSPPALSLGPPSACGAACTLVVEPDDGIAPVLSMIEGAQHSVNLVAYELEDASVVDALIAAMKRGVAVRVILDGTVSANETAYNTLHAAGVGVEWSPAYFTYTHEKSLVADGAGFIMSFNLVPKYYPTGRDFGIIDDDSADVSAMETTFNHDWSGDNTAAAPAGDNLVWSPGSRDAIMALIASATGSLEIYNEEMADPGIIAALEDAASRGVSVEVVMTYSSDWKRAFAALAAAGVRVRTYPMTASGLYIHAKMAVADDARAFIGSENFSATSLDHNRELGIMVVDPSIIASLESTFAGDWASAVSFRS